MNLSSVAIAESQVAYRQIRRYKNSSSLFPVLFLLVIPLVDLLDAARHSKCLLHVCLSSLPGAAIIALLVFFHFYHRRILKTKAQDAKRHLDFLRTKYGPEIDTVAKESPVLRARSKLLWN
jgi:hypothetical protein